MNQVNPNVVIFDIDGTLADCSHRLHFIQPKFVKAGELDSCYEENEQAACYVCGSLYMKMHKAECKLAGKDWESFFREDLILQDNPIEPIKALFHRFIYSHVLVLVTGRMEKHRSITNEWFKKRIYWEVPVMYMRKDNDFREDAIIKEEVLHEHIGAENVLFVIEDRKRVCDMWRKNGIMCLQCAEGDY